ncbi:MAG TPA: polysaccharide deacetylase family protein [Firmicutes bacterium]|jgi:probable sporulation protein (polysaccharide deacetylase family)|nr:polysaccharide deacetylase family protein [Bacillota bacterium]
MRKLHLLVIMLMVGAVLGGLSFWRCNSQQELRVAMDVVLVTSPDGRIEISAWTASELREYLEQLAEHLAVPAIEPAIDPITKGVIPGLCGRVLDVEATIDEALVALPGAAVQAAYTPVYPTSLWEFSQYPIFQGNSAKKEMALVINVAWGNENLSPMLATLEEEQVRATFFLVGRWAAKYPDLVRAIAAGGHEFGNHAYSDPHLPMLSREAIAQEIERTSAVIKEITGQEVLFFSPPYNDFDQKVLEVASEQGYLTVLCSLDTADWMRPGVERIVRRIVPRAHNGGIVLMHPTEQTPQALIQIIKGLKEQGYKLVTISQLLSPNPEKAEIPRPTLE